jgi:hypothetical protein
MMRSNFLGLMVLTLILMDGGLAANKASAHQLSGATFKVLYTFTNALMWRDSAQRLDSKRCEPTTRSLSQPATVSEACRPDCDRVRMTGKPEVIGSSVGSVRTNALAVTDR